MYLGRLAALASLGRLLIGHAPTESLGCNNVETSTVQYESNVVSGSQR